MAHGAPDFLMPPVADQQHFPAFPVILLGLVVNPRNQRANSVDDPEVTRPGPLEVFRRGAVGREHYQRTLGDLLDVFDGDGAAAFQVVHHVGVVDDLVFDVHRGAELLEADVDHIDSPDHTGAKAARGAEQDLQGISPDLWVPAMIP